jgi:hypothetical protein
MTTKTEENLSSPIPHYLLIITLGAILGAGLVFILPSYLELVAELGFKYGVPKRDITSDYASALVWATFLGFSIPFWPIKHEDKTPLIITWYVKCILTLFILLFLESQGIFMDAPGYYIVPQDPIFIDMMHRGEASVGISEPGRSGTWNIWILIAHYNNIIPAFLEYSYHSLKITFSMIALIAIYVFYRTTVIYTGKDNHRFYYFLAFFPSVLIWGSWIGKEPLILLAFSLFFLGVIGWHRKNRLAYIFIGLIGLTFICYIRLWVGSISIFSLIIYLISKNRSYLSKAVYIMLGSIALISTFNAIFTMWSFKSSQDVINKFESTANNTARGRTGLKSEKKFSGVADLISYAPTGMFKALFRPFPWDVAGIAGAISGLEGLLLLFLFCRAFKRSQMKDIKEPIVIFGITLVSSWAFLYGFSIQNFGTALRWRLQILPILLGLLCYLGRRRYQSV